MHVVSVINYKGGVGKTSVTANIGAELAHRGFRILLVDLDAQASLTFSFVTPDEWLDTLADTKTIKSWFDSFEEGPPASLSDLIITPTRAAGMLQDGGQLDLIASHLGLINVDLDLATKLGGASMKENKRNYLRVHRRLAEGLAALDDEAYDLVLIDCPPNFNVVTKTAIIASNHILIPAKPDYLSTMGIDYLRKSVGDLVTDYNEYASAGVGVAADEIHPEILGVIFTMVMFNSDQPIRALRPFIAQTKKLGMPVFKSYVRENKTIFADAPQLGVPVVLTHYGNFTHDRVVTELEAVATEFAAALGL